MSNILVNGTAINGASVLRSIRSISRLPDYDGQAVWTGDKLVDRDAYESKREQIESYIGWHPVEDIVCGWRFLGETDRYGNYISICFAKAE